MPSATATAPLPWQANLERAHTRGQLPHGLLLTGPSVQALESAAHWMAQKLLNPRGLVTDHADYFELRPANKMRQIGAEAMRGLLHDLHQTSLEGAGKVAVIHEADRMNRIAANAFLKTLEEPPLGTYLLLLSAQSRALLPTLRSRCATVRIPDADPPLQDPQWSDWLQQLQSWLEALVCIPKTPQDRAHAVMTCYGLIAALAEIEARLAATAWKSQKATLGELPEETLLALEVSCRKGILSQLLTELAQSMRQVWRLHQASQAYCESMQALRQAQGLLELNLPAASALESVFLTTLRSWTRPR